MATWRRGRCEQRARRLGMMTRFTVVAEFVTLEQVITGERATATTLKWLLFSV